MDANSGKLLSWLLPTINLSIYLSLSSHKLDVYRFHWSQLTLAFLILAVIVVLLCWQRIGMKTMAQMKVGSTGMFVGRTTTDCRFENKVGSEMLHIAYRKPEWSWDAEVDTAEKTIIKGSKKNRTSSSTTISSLFSESRLCTNWRWARLIPQRALLLQLMLSSPWIGLRRQRPHLVEEGRSWVLPPRTSIP